MDTMHAAAEIAQRLSVNALEVLKEQKDHSTPLRYVYGTKKRKAKRLASQAKGLYEVNAKMQTNSPFTAHVLARGPQKAIEIVLLECNKGRGLTNLIVNRICGVTAGTKERIL
jgi:hypothetical protein